MFSKAEIILPKKMLNAQKIQECKNVAYFLFNISNAAGRIAMDLSVEEALNLSRSNERRSLTKYFFPDTIIGISKNSVPFFYEYSAEADRYLPHSDSDCYNPLPIFGRSLYGIPEIFKDNKFMIVHRQKRWFHVTIPNGPIMEF